MTHNQVHSSGGQNDGQLAVAVGANVVLTIAQIAGGVAAGSLSLVADALHNLNDAASLGIALVARRIARKPADRMRTFGYRRAEIVGALINLVTLVLVGLYLIYEAVVRFINPSPVEGWIVVIVATIALIVDIGTALLTFAGSKRSINIKAAFVHNVSDALASVGVIVAGSLILLYQWHIADLVVTILISGYVLYQGVRMMPKVIHTLMEGTPADLSLDEICRAVGTIDGVVDVYHIHVWELDEEHRALEAHVVVDSIAPSELEKIKSDVKVMCRQEFRIQHSTIELVWDSVSTRRLDPSVCDEGHC